MSDCFLFGPHFVKALIYSPTSLVHRFKTVAAE